MSGEVRQLRPPGRPFSSASAPRQGGKQGRRFVLNQKDFAKAVTKIREVLNSFDGEKVEREIWRKEDPAGYVKHVDDFNLKVAQLHLLAQQRDGASGGALINISINRFFAVEEPTVIDGGNDDNPAA